MYGLAKSPQTPSLLNSASCPLRLARANSWHFWRNWAGDKACLPPFMVFKTAFSIGSPWLS